MPQRRSSRTWAGPAVLALILLVLIVGSLPLEVGGPASAHTTSISSVSGEGASGGRAVAIAAAPPVPHPASPSAPPPEVAKRALGTSPAFNVSITALPASVDVEPVFPAPGSYSTNLTAHAFGGSGGNGYQWSVNGQTQPQPGSGCILLDQPVVRCVPTLVGTYTITVSVEDSLGTIITSPAFSLVVNRDPTASIAATPPAGPLPYVTSFSAQFTNGQPPFTYSWNFGDGSPASNATAPSHQFYVVGRYDVTLVATDSVGGVAEATVSVGVIYHLKVLLTVQPINYTYEWANLDFNTTVNGTGIWPYVYAWNDLPTGCVTRDLSAISCSPNETGRFNVSVTVTDGAGEQATDNLTLILRAISTPTSQPTPILSVETFTFAMILIGVGAAAWLVFRALPSWKKSGEEEGPPTFGGASLPPPAPEAALMGGPPPSLQPPPPAPEELPGGGAPPPGPDPSSSPPPDSPAPDTVPPLPDNSTPDDAAPPFSESPADPGGSPPIAPANPDFTEPPAPSP
jgi:PKD repeat protein